MSCAYLQCIEETCGRRQDPKRDAHVFDGLDCGLDPQRQVDASRTDPHKGQTMRSAVSFQDFINDPRDGSVDHGRIEHDAFLFSIHLQMKKNLRGEPAEVCPMVGESALL